MRTKCYYCEAPIESGVICDSKVCKSRYRLDDTDDLDEPPNVSEKVECECGLCRSRFIAESKYVRFCDGCRPKIAILGGMSVWEQGTTI
jgi:hypothetical protein